MMAFSLSAIRLPNTCALPPRLGGSTCKMRVRLGPRLLRFSAAAMEALVALDHSSPADAQNNDLNWWVGALGSRGVKAPA